MPPVPAPRVPQAPDAGPGAMRLARRRSPGSTALGFPMIVVSAEPAGSRVAAASRMTIMKSRWCRPILIPDLLIPGLRLPRSDQLERGGPGWPLGW